jgi:hypothetical protein
VPRQSKMISVISGIGLIPSLDIDDHAPPR